MFFSKLDEILQDGQIVNLNLLKKDGRMHVCLVPKAQKMPDEVANKLIPLSICGSAVELDQSFIEIISQPVRERLGLISNVDAFKKNTESATKSSSQSCIKQERKSSKKEQMILEAEIHEKNKRWPEAYQIYKKLLAGEPNDPTMKAKVMELWDKMAQRPLFETQDIEDNTTVVEDLDIKNPQENKIYKSDLSNKDEYNKETQNELHPQSTENKYDMFADVINMAQQMS